jgi:hypothetical protein
MLTAKKLLFAVPFLIFFTLSFYLANPFLKSTDILFSFDINLLKELLFLCLIIFLAGLFFTVFSSLADDWRYVSVVAVVASATILLVPAPLNFIVVPASIVLLILCFWSLFGKLKTYFTFNPNIVLGGTVKSSAKVMVLLISLLYLFSIKQQVIDHGFKLPDNLVDTVIKFGPQVQDPTADTTTTTSSTPSLPAIPPDQIALLKQHPELLKQYGLTPQMLDSLIASPTTTKTTTSAASSPSNTAIKKLINDQVQTIIQPYMSFIPYVLAGLFFITLYSLVGLVLLFTGPILSLTFWLLEKTEFIHFTTETREIQKMVV